MRTISDGVWPTMLTPFTADNRIDYNGVEEVIDWYVENGVDGIFAVCQSSEMFFLSLEERVKLARFVKEKAGNRIPVIASGHVSDSFEDQVEEIKRVWDTGVEAFVLVSNRFAGEDETEEVWKNSAEKLLERLPEVKFGIYECPHPYKRLISPELLKWCDSTGRFLFLKDTCCDTEGIRAKLEAVKGGNIKIFNANSATLLESLKLGVAGFSGVMANFHPDLYVWLCRNWDKEPQKAQKLQNFLGVASMAEARLYPVSAKYHMQLEGLKVLTNGRSQKHELFTLSNRLEMEQLYSLGKDYRTSLGI